MNFNVLLLFLTEILVVKYQLELTMIFIFFLSFGKTMGNFDLTTFLFDHISHFFTNSTTILTKFHEWISFSQWFFFKWISCISFKFLQLCTSNDNLKFKFEKNYRKKKKSFAMQIFVPERWWSIAMRKSWSWQFYLLAHEQSQSPCSTVYYTVA